MSNDKQQSYVPQKRFKVEEKRLMNNLTVDVNQLMPMKYAWAWEHYINGCNNNWLPSEVPGVLFFVEYA